MGKGRSALGVLSSSFLPLHDAGAAPPTQKVLVTQLCLALWDPMDCSPLSMGFSQARILEWVAVSFSRGSS